MFDGLGVILRNNNHHGLDVRCSVGRRSGRFQRNLEKQRVARVTNLSCCFIVIATVLLKRSRKERITETKTVS